MDFSIIQAFTVESVIREFLISTYCIGPGMANHFLLAQNFSSEAESREQEGVEYEVGQE